MPGRIAALLGHASHLCRRGSTTIGILRHAKSTIPKPSNCNIARVDFFGRLCDRSKPGCEHAPALGWGLRAIRAMPRCLPEMSLPLSVEPYRLRQKGSGAAAVPSARVG